MIAALLAAGSDLCPHQASRKSCTIHVFPEGGNGKPLGLCLTCKTTFDRLIEDWDAGRIGEANVRLALAALGWPAEDAQAFIDETLQVVAA